MKIAFRWVKPFLPVLFVAIFGGVSTSAQAVTLPLAAQSNLTGLVFEEKPVLLPVERNFQMAMLSVSSQLGRSCGRIEAYAWPFNQSEQNRVNDVFKSTVDRLRTMGFVVSQGNLKKNDGDISVFTADVPHKHFVFLWAASEFGLVLNICETSAPIAPTHRPISLPPPVQIYPVEGAESLGALDKSEVSSVSKRFTPVGAWEGAYSCSRQGYTGATLQISSLNGDKFKGVFKFYPTDKNPLAPRGAYNVYGQYDKDTGLILINPGRWIRNPDNMVHTVMVGRFDTEKQSLGAYFEGVKGCTSFEARHEGFSTVKEKKEVAFKEPAKKKAATSKKPRKARSAAVKASSKTPAKALVAPESENADIVSPTIGISLAPGDAASPFVSTLPEPEVAPEPKAETALPQAEVAPTEGGTETVAIPLKPSPSAPAVEALSSEVPSGANTNSGRKSSLDEQAGVIQGAEEVTISTAPTSPPPPPRNSTGAAFIPLSE